MESTDDCLLVFTTFPNSEIAQKLGTELVEKQLAACVNLLSPATSIYVWQGKIETESEIPAILKTTRAVFPKLETELSERHPYDVPEIVAIPVEAGAERYLAWIREQVL
ncbi:MAG: divalent-cation tolerance protein CutA [Verrucomicrobiota bacterium]